MTSDLWIGEYEKIFDDWVGDCQKYGVAVADENAELGLRALGLDRHEIAEHMEALRA